jgi:hypothetical protein
MPLKSGKSWEGRRSKRRYTRDGQDGVQLGQLQHESSIVRREARVPGKESTGSSVHQKAPESWLERRNTSLGMMNTNASTIGQVRDAWQEKRRHHEGVLGQERNARLRTNATLKLGELQ